MVISCDEQLIDEKYIKKGGGDYWVFLHLGKKRKIENIY